MSDSNSKRQRVRLLPDANKPIPHVPGDTSKPGDKRPPGRPKGALNKLSNAAREHAAATGELPHMFLLRITRGEVISTDVMDPVTGELRKVYQVPDLPMRMDAAKAAAPYFAPKLSAVEVATSLTDEELNLMLQQYGAQAGLQLAQRAAAADDEADDALDTDKPWLPEQPDDDVQP